MNKSMANLLIVAGVITPMCIGKKSGSNAQIRTLLNTAEREYRNGGNVDKIVGSFAKAQSLIHSPNWKRDAESNAEKIQIVNKFTKLGQELSS